MWNIDDGFLSLAKQRLDLKMLWPSQSELSYIFFSYIFIFTHRVKKNSRAKMAFISCHLQFKSPSPYTYFWSYQPGNTFVNWPPTQRKKHFSVYTSIWIPVVAENQGFKVRLSIKDLKACHKTNIKSSLS